MRISDWSSDVCSSDLDLTEIAALDQIDIALPPRGLRRAIGRGEGRDQGELRDAPGRAAHHLERDETAHRVADQREFRRGVVEQALREALYRVVAAVVGDGDFAVDRKSVV